MATLVLDQSNFDLRVSGDTLALYQEGTRQGSLPIKLLERVVLQGDMSLTVGVLTRLAEEGVPIMMLSKRHSRRLALVLGPAHNNAAIRLAQSQRVFDADWCVAWARRQVLRKTQAQARLLVGALKARPDCRKPLYDASNSLEQGLARLYDYSETLRMDTIRGVEGAMARAYFQGLMALFPPSLKFTGRNRRPPRDPVNACLSLAYTMTHFEAVRAAHAAGLDPLLGFYHRPTFGRESLASDLIEPFRPRVDEWVWVVFRDRVLRVEHFGHDKEACLLGKAGRAIFYQGFDSFVRPLRRALWRQCQVLAGHLKREGEPYLMTEEEDEVL